MTDTADTARSLTHDEAVDCIIGAAGVSVLSYEEAIAAYSRLRHFDSLAARLDALAQQNEEWKQAAQQCEIGFAFQVQRADAAEARVRELEAENERLRATIHGMQDGALVRDQAALIERLTKTADVYRDLAGEQQTKWASRCVTAESRVRELEELYERDGRPNRVAELEAERNAIEAKTIKRCAKVVEKISWLNKPRLGAAAARVIRAMGKAERLAK